MEKYGFVYLWYDKKRGMFYIGCRWGTEDDGYVCSSTRMRNAYRRRPQDFSRRVLSRIEDRNGLLEEEHKWLQLIKEEELGKRYYNLRKHRWGHWSTDENSRKAIGQKISENHSKNPNWSCWSRGKIVSEETKQKIRQARLGKPRSEETKQKCRSYRHTDEAKRKISEASLRRWRNNK